MTTVDTNKRIRPSVLQDDISTLNGLASVAGYVTTRAEADAAALRACYDTMLAKQAEEDRLRAQFSAAADAARLGEWEFHTRVIAVREAVRGQFGSDSDAAQAVGLKKKSERKAPRRKNGAV